MMDPNDTCCANCQYFLLGENCPYIDEAEEHRLHPFNGDSEGECHAKPPQNGGESKLHDGKSFRNFGEWPKVMGADWCGKFKPRRKGVIYLEPGKTQETK